MQTVRFKLSVAYVLVATPIVHYTVLQATKAVVKNLILMFSECTDYNIEYGTCKDRKVSVRAVTKQQGIVL